MEKPWQEISIWQAVKWAAWYLKSELKEEMILDNVWDHYSHEFIGKLQSWICWKNSMSHHTYGMAKTYKNGMFVYLQGTGGKAQTVEENKSHL